MSGGRNISVEEELKLIKRGTVDIVSEEELVEKLKRSRQTGKPLVIKMGADPSAPDLHLGHTVPLRKLRQFQNLGHKVVFLIGDFTAMIGDPTGRSSTRKRLTRDEVLRNAETYQRQIFKILDPDKTEIRFNSEWCSPMKFADVLELTSRYTVARLLERDDFQKRYREGKPISLIEFMYPLIQGYDSVVLEADVEVGGTDQIFNLLVGRDLQREYGQEPQVALTMPIIEGTDGTQKMSKSFGNYIAIEDPPNEMFGKIMSIPDFLIIKYFELLTDVPIEEIEKKKKELEEGRNPRDVKAELGWEIVREFYGEEEADKARKEFDRVFKEKQLPSEMPEFRTSESEIPIVDLITSAGMVGSRGEAKRLIKQGGVYVDGERIRDITEIVKIKNGSVIKVGKRKFVRIVKV